MNAVFNPEREQEGVIEDVCPLLNVPSLKGRTIWWLLTLRGGDTFAFHNNAAILFGPFRPGDRVRYVVARGRMIDGYARLSDIRIIDDEEEEEWGEVRAEL